MTPYWTGVAARLCRWWRTAATIHEYIDQFGGFRPLTQRAIELARREGFRGVLRRAALVARRNPADGRNNYETWVERYDTLSDETRCALKVSARELTVQPLLSVIMPVYNPEPAWLMEAIDSVRAQLYTNWELCIADDASSNPLIRTLLEQYAEMDARIHIVLRQQNGHISAASNSAFAIATGEWVVLFDHDDVLPDHALFWLAEAINRCPHAALIYSDEDKITSRGVRCAPHFKPDWNYELLLSYNYICHLGAYRRDLVKNIGGFREGLEGAQDYDLVLRCVERITAAQIVHIPRVLYHWRIHPGSTALGGESKPYAAAAGERVLRQHFERRGVFARVDFQSDGHYLATYDFGGYAPTVSVIVVCNDAINIAEFCTTLTSKTRYQNCEFIFLVRETPHPTSGECGQSSGLFELSPPHGIHRLKVVVERCRDNRKLLIDDVVSSAQSEFVGFVSEFLIPRDDDWLTVLLSIAMQSGVGVVGPRLVNRIGNVVAGGQIFGINGGVGCAHRGLLAGDRGYFQRAVLPQTVTAVPSDCFVVRKSTYTSVCGLGSTIVPDGMEVADFCLRLKEAGYRNVYAGHVVMEMHDDVASAALGLGMRAAGCREVFHDAGPEVQERWFNALQADPAYNPNLSVQFEDFSLAWPPRLRPMTCPSLPISRAGSPVCSKYDA